MVAKKKKTTKKQARPKTTKTKVVYRTRTVYKDAKETNPMGDVGKTVGQTMGWAIPTMIGFGVAGAVVKTIKDI